ncbi:hypothetical protein DWV83_03360 [Coprobacillus sp. AF13-15]|nr:hypothetical protein DWV95_05175 [Coprobacillus sp. AF13-4LB]RHS17969.1 hypothetical protein DWV86_04360 [Coprobacillus sp. AF13-25]RHS19905.1 hypothetical protein DWV83_03360 [Coprobacillus sp. AF13-15]
MKNKMYHLSLYFDEKTNQKLSFLSKQIEKELHQNYLEKHHIPFHLTVATYKEIKEDKFIELANELFTKGKKQELYFVSIGCFQKSTLYLLPVYNEFLNQLILKVHHTFDENVSISQKNRYLPYHFVPHVSISRKLNEQQTNQVFKILNHYFEPFHGKVNKIVLAKTNPYQEIKIWDL